MRQVVLDTETTGLEVVQGHRIIEIGCVEMLNRRATGRVLHHYLNPDREIEEGAQDVHGITSESLADKPRFADIAAEFLEFVKGAELIIHNAPFDVAFLDAELERLGPEWGRIADHCTVIDTLAMAREMHPGQKNSLDALCARYGVDNSSRELHGALLDARLLMDVYLAMTGGQVTLMLEEEGMAATGVVRSHRRLEGERPALRVILPTAEELEAHRRRLDLLDRDFGGPCVWRRLEQESPGA
jgi:DNA polymerase-3 subunit epsilon